MTSVKSGARRVMRMFLCENGQHVQHAADETRPEKLGDEEACKRGVACKYRDTNNETKDPRNQPEYVEPVAPIGDLWTKKILGIGHIPKTP